VNALKRCKDKVVLVVSKAENPFPSSPTIGQIPHLAPSNFNRPIMARSVSEEELNGPRQVILQKSAAGESSGGNVFGFSFHFLFYFVLTGNLSYLPNLSFCIWSFDYVKVPIVKVSI
jgi:hypothetical protein